MLENTPIEPFQRLSEASPWEVMGYDSRTEEDVIKSLRRPQKKENRISIELKKIRCSSTELQRKKVKHLSSALTEWDRLDVQHRLLKGMKGVKSISRCTLDGISIPGSSNVKVKTFKNGKVKCRGCVKRCKTLDCASCGLYMRTKEAEQITLVGEVASS